MKMTKEKVLRVAEIIRDRITYTPVTEHTHKAVCSCGKWESVPHNRIGRSDTEAMTREVWEHAFAHFRHVDPETIAAEYAQAIADGDINRRIQWETRIPSVIHPKRELIDKFVDVADEVSKRIPAAKTEAEGWLWSALCQDGAAVATGMPEGHRVTCEEHNAWRTEQHLQEHHQSA